MRLTTRALTAVTLLLGFAAPTGAQAAADPPPPVLPVTLTADGFTPPVPNPRPAGPVTFAVNTTDPHGHWWTVSSLRDGVTLAQATQELTASYSSDPAVALPALRAFYHDAYFYGGVSITPSSPLTFTETLPSGTYYLIDTQATTTAGTATSDAPSHQAVLTVVPPEQPASPRSFDGVIDAVPRNSKTAFTGSCRLPAHGAVSLRNHATQPEEFIFVAVRPDTTRAQIDAYFAAELAGGPLPANPFGATAGGLLSLSPGHRATFGYDFPPGRYAVLSFDADQQNGVKSAMEGTYLLVTLS